ncbi:hypothetical protein BLA29_015226, partial [Euroglyphus maynei]
MAHRFYPIRLWDIYFGRKYTVKKRPVLPPVPAFSTHRFWFL